MKTSLRLSVIFIWMLGIGVTVWPKPARAANFTYNAQITYRAVDNDQMQVSQTYTVTNNTANYYLTELSLTTPSDQISGLKVTYNDGANIPATTIKKTQTQGDIKYDYQEIHLVFPRSLYGVGRNWSFTVNYLAKGLIDAKGSAHTVYIPGLATSGSDDYKVTLDVPTSYGNPHFSNAGSAENGINNGRQLYGFSKSDLGAGALTLAFGDSTVYDLNFNFPLANDSAFSRTETITLPPDLNNQKSYINRLDPAPANLRLDDDGNVLADYHLASHQHLTVKTDVAGQVKYLDYDLAKSGKRSDIPADLVGKYTKPTRYWQTGGDVAAAAHKLTDDNAPVINNVKAMYQFVIDKLSYNDDKVKFNVRQGSAAALANPSNAVCLEYADLLIAMLRSQGIPARMPIGYGYSGSLKSASDVSSSLHSWVEAYIPGIGWMTLDPTWGEKFDEFGKSDLDHFAFAVWGERDSLPEGVMSGVTDLGYQYENASLSFLNAVQKLPATGQMTLHHFVVLPFVDLEYATVKAQPSVASDNNFVVLGGHRSTLGSLAPSQTTHVARLIFGRAWPKSSEGSFEQGTDGQALTLARVKANPDWRPLLGLIVLAVGGSSWLVVRSFSRKKAVAGQNHE